MDKLSLPKFLEEVKVVARESKLKREALERTALLASAAAKIGSGHAYDKHISEFADLGIFTKSELVDHIIMVMNNSTHTGKLERDREFFYISDSNTLVIVDKNSIDGGSTFRPYNKLNYVLNELK